MFYEKIRVISGKSHSRSIKCETRIKYEKRSKENILQDIQNWFLISESNSILRDEFPFGFNSFIFVCCTLFTSLFSPSFEMNAIIVRDAHYSISNSSDCQPFIIHQLLYISRMFYINRKAKCLVDYFLTRIIFIAIDWNIFIVHFPLPKRIVIAIIEGFAATVG